MRRTTAVPIVSLLAFLVTGVAATSRAEAFPAPTGTFPTPELDLTRMGIFAPGHQFFTLDATKTQFVDLLGWADRVWEHPVAPCRNEFGATVAASVVQRSVRWGDLTVAFDSGGVMTGYIYEQRWFHRPAAAYKGLTLGTPVSALLTDPAAFLPGQQSPYGWLWRVRGQAPGIAGFSAGPGPDAEIRLFRVGSACFGLPD